MRGQFVFRPPAPIGNAIKDQEEKVKAAQIVVDAYKKVRHDNLVFRDDPRVQEIYNNAKATLQMEEDALERLRNESKEDSASGVSPAQGAKRFAPPRSGVVKPAQPQFEAPPQEKQDVGGKSQKEKEAVLPTGGTGGESEREKRDVGGEREPPLKKQAFSKEQEMLNQWTRELNSIVSRALAPLMRTLGIVAARLRYDDVRPLLRWKQDAPLVEDRLNLIESADSVEEFVSKNSPVVGTQLLRLYIASYKPPLEKEEGAEFSQAMIGSCFDLDIANPAAVSEWAYANRTRRALTQLGMSETEVQFAPAWAFEVMGSGIFRGVLSIACLGAFEAAAAQIRRIPNCSSFTIKELICSESVSDQFAFLVSSVFLSSGDETSKSNKGNQWSRNSTYLNITRMREQLGLSIYTCKIWFESVFAMPNPLLRVFQEKKRASVAKFQEELTGDKFQEYMVGEVKRAPPAKAIAIVRDFSLLRINIFNEANDLNDSVQRFKVALGNPAITELVKKTTQEALADLYRIQLREMLNATDAFFNVIVDLVTTFNVQQGYEELSGKMRNAGMDTRELDDSFLNNSNPLLTLDSVGRFKIVYKANLEQFYRQKLNAFVLRSKREAIASLEEKLDLYGNMLPKRELVYRG